MTIGERIKQYRKEKDLSLNKLAVLADVSQAYISQLENNKSDSPSVEIAQKIAKALEISILDLLSDNKSEQNCGNCRYYLIGACYRYPPVFIGKQDVVVDFRSDNYDEITEEQSVWEHPEVKKNNFCGEWKPKK